MDQVNKAVTTMDQITQRNAAQTEELAATASALANVSATLSAAIETFRIDAPGPAHSAHPPRALGPLPSTAGEGFEVLPSAAHSPAAQRSDFHQR